MIKSNSYFSRVLCALMLYAGFAFAGCTDGPLGDNQNTEQAGPATITIENVTYNSATFTGHLNVTASDLSFSQVTLYYSDAETFNMNAAQSASATSFDKDQNFTITLTNLEANKKYKYCVVAEVKSEKTYGDVLEFTTPSHPYDVVSNLNVSSATDLSSSGSANCYIVSESGLYKFKTVKGNSSESVGNVASASILWETFGTSTTPECLDLIKAVDYENGYIAFQTADTFKEGNAVIAAKDTNGNIIWSWHVWFTDQPKGQVYYNNAGTMMDRNLGATSATPGDVGALGLLYQWGRKDPFMGSSSISSSAMAASTGTWNITSGGSVANAEINPMTFYTSMSLSKESWASLKTIYDPCPSGWRVPDGGSNSVWVKVLGSSISFTNSSLWDSTKRGVNFSDRFGSDQTIWYPASGCRYYDDGALSGVGNYGGYWSASPFDYYPYFLLINYFGMVSPLQNDPNRATGKSVRCLQE